MRLCDTVHGTKGHTLSLDDQHATLGTEVQRETGRMNPLLSCHNIFNTHRNYSERCQTLTVPPSTLCPLDSRVIAQLMSLAPAQTDWITAFLPQQRERQLVKEGDKGQGGCLFCSQLLWLLHILNNNAFESFWSFLNYTFVVCHASQWFVSMLWQTLFSIQKSCMQAFWATSTATEHFQP